MINQRNISLISNKTHQNGGSRIPEEVIERDYCLGWFLIGLSHSSVKNKLAFKGGTALRFCYFKDYRFSEDLDFTLLKEIALEEILKEFKGIFSYIKGEAGILFDIGKQEQPSENTYTFYMIYEGPLPGRAKEIKVDITFREKMMTPIKEKKVIKTYEEYSDFEKGATIKVYSLEEVAIEKVCALLSLSRNEPRDLYDIWYLVEQGGIDLGHLISDIEKKIQFKGEGLRDKKEQLDKKEERLQKLWENRLSSQISTLPEYKDVFRAVKRAFRKAGII